MAIESKLDILIDHTRISRFVSVGIVGATIETIIVAILTGFLGINPLVAKAVGAETSISTMFVVNDQWTFANVGGSRLVLVVRRWIKSHAVRVVGLSVAFSVLYLLTSVVEFSIPVAGVELWPTVANLTGIGVGMSINYIAESLFTWQVDSK
ncbi:GtrA family protein [Haloferax marisrubri]|uniref:GtrA family protein n=1 Tax=Haloferax marisrubri TaxID=1544719 RepID=A0A2P4NQW6_9EURY|nr:GtrA family protein [Haloferax marisrubri]POG55531.1 GtrA family protein [Haloferax marisrubri]